MDRSDHDDDLADRLDTAPAKTGSERLLQHGLAQSARGARRLAWAAGRADLEQRAADRVPDGVRAVFLQETVRRAGSAAAGMAPPAAVAALAALAARRHRPVRPRQGINVG